VKNVTKLALLFSLVVAATLRAETRIGGVAGNTTTADWSTGVAYTYDPSGNVTRTGNDQYVYDEVGRLVRADVNGVTRTYSYDAFGNRKDCLQGGTDCQYGVKIDTATNRSSMKTTAGVETLNYDARGNLLNLGSHTYAYDAGNMMTRDTPSSGPAREFVYGPGDERVATYTVGGSWTWTLRDLQGKVLREFTSSNGTLPGNANFVWTRDNIFRDGLLLATRQPMGGGVSTYHYHLDHLGTARQVTDDSDMVVGSHDYYAFGPETSGGKEEPSRSRLRYTGHERDLWLNESLDTLDYMHARSYSPVSGRFLSVDKAPGNPSEVQSWNRYSYARNSPLRRVDPDGNADVDFYVLMDPGKNNPAYDRQWFADRLASQIGGLPGHTLRVSTDTRNAIANMRTSFAREGGLVGYFGHSDGIHLTDSGYSARGLNPRGNPGQIGISNQQLTAMINRGSAAVAVIAACSTDGCFAGGGLNGRTTVVAVQSPTGLTSAPVMAGALEAFNSVVVSGHGTVAQGVAAANDVFKEYKLKDKLVIVGGDPDRRLEQDQ
jgi:RHS repeat-associated protein